MATSREAPARTRKFVLVLMAAAIAAIFAASFTYRLQNPSLKVQTQPQAGGMGAMGGAMQAIRDLMQKVEQEPNNVGALTGLAESFMRIGAFDRAMEYLRRASEIEPNNVDVLERMGICQFEKESYPDAAATFTRITALDGKNALAYFNLGFVQRHHLGDEASGVANMKKALELAGNDSSMRKMIEEELSRGPDASPSAQGGQGGGSAVPAGK